MAVTSNYDSAGLSTGKSMIELYETVDTFLLNNITDSFRNHKNVPVSELDVKKWKQSATINQLKSVNIIKKAKPIAREIIFNDLDKSFTSGIDKVDTELIETDTPSKPTTACLKATKTNAQYIKIEALKALTAANNTALNNTRAKASNTVNSIAMAIPFVAAGTMLYDLIDRYNKPNIEKGISGKGNNNITSYTSLIVKQASTDTYRESISGRAKQYGTRLVQITTHASSCPLCRPFEDKILADDTLTRDGLTILSSKYAVFEKRKYIRLSWAISQGLFHFNCRHGKVPYNGETDKLAIPKNNPKSERLKKLTYDIEQKQRVIQRNIRIAKKSKDNALGDTARNNASMKISNNQSKLRQLEKIAKSNKVTFYRQNWKEQTEFNFETFKNY